MIPLSMAGCIVGAYLVAKANVAGRTGTLNSPTKKTNIEVAIKSPRGRIQRD